MDIAIYIVIGIVIAVVIFILVRKNSVTREHEMINDKKGKKTQFNPEKVSGLMPNEQKSEVQKEDL